MELLGLNDAALIHTEFNEKRVMELLNRTWEGRADLKAAIAKHLPEMRTKVTRILDDVAELLSANM